MVPLAQGMVWLLFFIIMGLRRGMPAYPNNALISLLSHMILAVFDTVRVLLLC